MSFFRTTTKPAKREGTPDRATASGGANITALITGSTKYKRADWEIWNRIAEDWNLVESYDLRMRGLVSSAAFLKRLPDNTDELKRLKSSLAGHDHRDLAEAFYLFHEMSARELPLGKFVEGEYQAPKRPTWQEFAKQPDLLRAPRCLCPGIHGRSNPGAEPPLPNLTLQDIIAAVNGGGRS